MKICFCVRFPSMSNGGINPDCPIHNPRTGEPMSYYPNRGGNNLPELPEHRIQEAREQYREELANEPASKLDIEKAREEAREETRASVQRLRNYVNDLDKYAYHPFSASRRIEHEKSRPAGAVSAIAMVAAILALILSIIAIAT